MSTKDTILRLVWLCAISSWGALAALYLLGAIR